MMAILISFIGIFKALHIALRLQDRFTGVESPRVPEIQPINSRKPQIDLERYLTTYS